MTLASPEFGELFSALLEVSTGSLKPVLPLAKLPVSTSSYSDWRRGVHVPSRKVLDGFLAKLKPLVGYGTWHRERIRRFDELAGRLQRIAAMREDALFSTYTRLRALSADAWADANQVIKPDRGLFREGVRLEDLRAEGNETQEEDIARLSPLKHRPLNLLGRYSFTASVPAAGALRPLRDPEAPELDEDEEGEE